jgi:hypothetical protein
MPAVRVPSAAVAVAGSLASEDVVEIQRTTAV